MLGRLGGGCKNEKNAAKCGLCPAKKKKLVSKYGHCPPAPNTFWHVCTEKISSCSMSATCSTKSVYELAKLYLCNYMKQMLRAI